MMTPPALDPDTYAHTLQTAYHEIHIHGPQTVSDAERRLRSKLETHGITLTTDILRALAFAAVQGRDLLTPANNPTSATEGPA